jgi:hypothetical protein
VSGEFRCKRDGVYKREKFLLWPYDVPFGVQAYGGKQCKHQVLKARVAIWWVD